MLFWPVAVVGGRLFQRGRFHHEDYGGFLTDAEEFSQARKTFNGGGDFNALLFLLSADFPGGYILMWHRQRHSLQRQFHL